MRRIIVNDRRDVQLFELAEADVFALDRIEQVNGEHSLEITTTRVLEQGQRVLLQDDRSYWHEYVVYGVDHEHSNGNRAIGTYYCTWSVQPDLQGTRVSRMPGIDSPTTASLALDAALSGTERWTRGTVTRMAQAGASMYDTDGWDAVSTLVKTWGGELSTTIDVSTLGFVTARKVDLYDKIGEQTAKRRFDFGADLKSVKRKVADGPLYCRITPRGKGEETDTGGYGRKINISSVNGGKDYLENAAMVDLAKLPDGNGGWEYPTLEIENGNMETPAELKAWAQSVLEDYTVPKITYTVDVMQLAREGVDMQGVSLGDTVQVIDRKFGDGLRISGRVTAMEVDELAGKVAKLTIGYLDGGLSGAFGSLGRQVGVLTETVQQMNGGTLSTADYLTRLLDRINTEINATGGYTYITEGHGIRTYDVAVSDPLVGAEASAVTEIKGGTIRIANSRDSQSAWEWKTVFTSGHIAGELVTAAQIVTGYIGSSGGTFIDLDSDTVQLGDTNSIHTIIDDEGMEIYSSATNFIAHFGYGDGKSKSGSISKKPYFTLGIRDTSQGIGNYSVVEGDSNIASAYSSHAEGESTTASGARSHAEGGNTTASGDNAHAEGDSTTASGLGSHAEGSYTTAGKDYYGYSHAEGFHTSATGDFSHTEGAYTSATSNAAHAEGNTTTASGSNSHAEGHGTIASGNSSHAGGMYNISNTSHLVSYGYGASNSRADVLYLTTGGNLWIKGTLTQNSDRRLKEHHSYLGEDAAEFIRKLKPALYTKDSERHVGFYAQDVQEAEPDSWNTCTVEAHHTDESLDFDPLTLDYSALIAPLTAYAQQLEKRIEQLESRIGEMEASA